MSATQHALSKSPGYLNPFHVTWQPPESVKKLFLTMQDQHGNRFCNVGTIGHVDWFMKPLTAAVIFNLPAVRHKLKRNTWHTHHVFG